MRATPSHSRLLAALCALALASLATTCQPSEPWTSDNPSFALNAFLIALRSGDDDTLEAFLSDETLAFLQATRQDIQTILGDQAAEGLARPADLLFRVWTPAATEIDHLETLSHDGDAAVVAVHSVFGDVRPVSMRRLHGRWVVDLVPEATPTPNPETP